MYKKPDSFSHHLFSIKDIKRDHFNILLETYKT